MDSVTNTAEADNRSTINTATSSTTTGTVDHQLSDASMVTVASVATMGVVVATMGAHVLYAALPGTRPSIALRQVEASVPLPKHSSALKPCHFMNGHHLMIVFFVRRLLPKL